MIGFPFVKMYKPGDHRDELPMRVEQPDKIHLVGYVGAARWSIGDKAGAVLLQEKSENQTVVGIALRHAQYAIQELLPHLKPTDVPNVAVDVVWFPVRIFTERGVREALRAHFTAHPERLRWNV